MGKTIRELAEAIGVSKTAIRKHMTEEFRAAHTATTTGNVIEIDDAGCEKIAESFRKSMEKPETKLPETEETKFLREEIEFLRKQLEAKDLQIAANQEQISQLTTALAHAQALHAGTMHQQLESGDPQTDAAIDIDDQRQGKGKRKWWSFKKT